MAQLRLNTEFTALLAPYGNVGQPIFSNLGDRFWARDNLSRASPKRLLHWDNQVYLC